MDVDAAHVELQMSFDGTYLPALSIPLSDCQRFSTRPLSWLRYVASTIYGGEGDISTSHGGPAVDYDRADIQPGSYYYVTQNAERLLDPDLMDERTSALSAYSKGTISTSQGDFEYRVSVRDGGLCAMSNSKCDAVACHIVPHSKGRQYMINLVRHRGMEDSFEPPLESINDTRNGIRLHTSLHRHFGRCNIGFLRTPNFAMSVNDVPFVEQPPMVGYKGPRPPNAPRLTFQLFKQDKISPLTTLTTPHNCDAKQTESSEWPPGVVFDLAYGGAALDTWGVPAFMEFARERVTAEYYCSDGEGCGGDQGVEGPSCRGDKKTKRNVKARRTTLRKRVGGRASKREPDAADIILGLRMHTAKKAQRRAQAKKVGETQKKVRAWLGAVEE